MENTQIQYQARYKISHLIMEHAIFIRHITMNGGPCFCGFPFQITKGFVFSPES